MLPTPSGALDPSAAEPLALAPPSQVVRVARGGDTALQRVSAPPRRAAPRRPVLSNKQAQADRGRYRQAIAVTILPRQVRLDEISNKDLSAARCARAAASSARTAAAAMAAAPAMAAGRPVLRRVAPSVPAAAAAGLCAIRMFVCLCVCLFASWVPFQRALAKKISRDDVEKKVTLSLECFPEYP
jgi:hypothetical protein